MLVEALPALAAELTGATIRAVQRRRQELLVRGVLVDVLGGVAKDVDAGEVERGERSHGVAEAEPAGDVDVLGGRDPDSASATASMTSAQISRVVTNPATSRFTTMQVLPTPSANARAGASVSSLVRWPRTSSHSAIIGTGEKKCVPTTRSGRAVTAAIAVIGIAEVLVASTASSRAELVEHTEHLVLRLDLLEDGLDDDLGVADGVEIGRGGDAGEGGVRVGPAEPSLATNGRTTSGSPPSPRSGSRRCRDRGGPRRARPAQPPARCQTP